MSIPRYRRKKPVAPSPRFVELVELPNVYTEDKSDPYYIPPFLRRTLAPVHTLFPSQREAYYRGKKA